MACEIVRKIRYQKKLVKLLSYIEQEYGFNHAVSFLMLIEKKEAMLKMHPYTGAPTGVANTRSIHVTGHNRLFYRISGNRVLLINLFDTRMRSYKKPM